VSELVLSSLWKEELARSAVAVRACIDVSGVLGFVFLSGVLSLEMFSQVAGMFSVFRYLRCRGRRSGNFWQSRRFTKSRAV
jgi:hypothetical protein